MIDSFSDELCKIAAELPYKGEQRIGYAIRKHKPVSNPSKGEKVHLRMGDVHYGESRFGPHFGYEQKGEKVHIFPDRTYVGRSSKGGKEERLTVPQREKARAAIKHMKRVKESALNNLSKGGVTDKLKPKKMIGSSEQIFTRVKRALPPPQMSAKAPIHKVPSVAKAVAKAVL
jgi:hypothetical protein